MEQKTERQVMAERLSKLRFQLPEVHQETQCFAPRLAKIFIN